MSATATATAPDPLRPQPSGGLVRGAGLALLVHAALLLALTTVVQWRSTAPESVSAELWAALPQAAPPPAAAATPAPPPAQPSPPVAPPAEPPPPPRTAPAPEPAEVQAQIALEQARKRQADLKAREQKEREREEHERVERLQREQLAREKLQKEQKELKAKQAQQEREEKLKQERAAKDKEKDKQKAEEARLAELRRQQLARMMGQVGGSGSTPGATAATSSGPSASYAGRLIAAIKPNVVFTDSVSGNAAAEVEVRAGPSGSILSRRLVRSSGHKDWDEAVLRAIDRTGTLPRDVDGRVPPVILMAFRPNELQP